MLQNHKQYFNKSKVGIHREKINRNTVKCDEGCQEMECVDLL